MSARHLHEAGPEDQLRDLIESGEPEVVLSGYAGAGKTTLVRKLTDMPGLVLCAPTNKAARRLGEVTGLPTTTVHALVYGAAEEAWIRPDGSVCQGYPIEGGGLMPPPGCPDCRCRSELRFGAPKAVAGARVIVVDEASMIGAKLARDIRGAVAKHAAGAQILWVGDPAQLPPVKDDPGVDLHHPDVMLDKVHRAEGGILQIATAIRQAPDMRAIEAILQRAAAGAFSDVSLHRGGVEAIAEWRARAPSRYALAHTNRDRQAINRHVREILAPGRAYQGHVGPLVVGDRLLLRENVHAGEERRVVMMNSEVYGLVEVQPLVGAPEEVFVVTGHLDGERKAPRRRFVVHAGFLADADKDVFGRAARGLREVLKPQLQQCYACRSPERVFCGVCSSLAKPFASDPNRVWCEGCGGPRDALWAVRKPECSCGPHSGLALVNVQYGYALTVHAAQGSEADEVGVYWTPWSHRSAFEDARAWLYTAVTRARKTLRIWR